MPRVYSTSTAKPAIEEYNNHYEQEDDYDNDTSMDTMDNTKDEPLDADDEFSWSLVRNFFDENGPVSHQITTFDHFINYGFPRIINEEPDVYFAPDHDKGHPGYRVSFSDLYIPFPTVIEEDRSVHDLYPHDARIRDLTYDSPILVTITETTEYPNGKVESKTHTRVQIGKLPIMLRSDRCHLTSMTPRERIKAGECEFDHGGYFVIKGKERVLISQLRDNYNTVKVSERKLTLNEKFKYVAEMRSMSEETGHSVLLQAMLGIDNRTLVCSIPYITSPVPIGVVFKAMGITNSDTIRTLINLDFKQARKYVDYVILDSIFVNETSDGKDMFIQEEKAISASLGKKTKTDILEKRWLELSQETKNSYRDKMTRVNALMYIGKFAKHSPKENERYNYVKQVIDTELFPHMGINMTMTEKVYMWSYMIRKLIKTIVGMRQEDDRDHYKHKRIESAGLLCYDLTRQLFKKFKDAIQLGVEKKRQHPNAMSIIPRLTVLTKGYKQNFSTGNWGAPKNSYIRTGVSQVLSRLSFGATLSNIRRVNNPIGKEAKNSKIRQIGQSQIMYICPVECFAPDTPILLWNGTIVHAESIVTGNFLIDDKGEPVRVKSTCLGFKDMYDILPHQPGFMSHTVTSNHILTLQVRDNEEECITIHNKKFRVNDVVDITIDDYLNLPKVVQRNLVLFKTSGINWPRKEVPIKPYILGRLINQGMHTNNPVSELVTITEDYIFSDYLINDHNTRLYLLAGLIDASDKVTHSLNRTSISFKQKRIKLNSDGIFRDIKFLVSSLGFSFEITKKKIGYKVIRICGLDLGIIPCKVMSEGVRGSTMNSNNSSTYLDKSFLQSSFSLVKSGEQPYVGWQLEGNGRFLLGDMTMSHNTPEGPQVGIVLNLTMMAILSKYFPTHLARKVIEGCTNIKSIQSTQSEQSVHTEQELDTEDDLDEDECDEDVLVFLNGNPVGITRKPHDLVNELKMARDAHRLAYDVSISYNETDQEINVYSDEGRMIRPLYTVSDNKVCVKQSDGTNWSELVKRGLIKYLDHSEIDNAVVAFSKHDLNKYCADYCEIHAALMLGLLGSIIPYSDHSQSPRNCYSTSQGKQAIGLFATTFGIRTDTLCHVLYHPQRSLVSTRMSRIIGFNQMPSGINTIVAICCYNGLTL